LVDLYFSHDRNALSDIKISQMRGIYGMEGYGVYWALVEALSREDTVSLEYSERTATGLKLAFMTSFDMKQYIDDCISIGLFDTDGERFWSASLRRRIRKMNEIIEKRRTAGIASGVARRAKGGLPLKEREEPKPFDEDGWQKFAVEYERELGLLPTGSALETLISYYDDVGCDLMIYAVEQTNLAQVQNPFPYLKKILETYARKGIKTVNEARALTIERDRVKRGMRSGDKAVEESVRWI